MKHLFLTASLLLSAVAGYAQNTVTTTQTGTAQSLSATQAGSSLTATISQVGSVSGNTNNLGLTVQAGTGHNALINQNNGSTYNRAGITQLNGSSLNGANSATISQSNGSGGTSMQTGVPGSASGTEGNWAGIAQTGGGNKASIVADGANTRANFAETWQRGTTNTATTTQNGGSLNRAQIFQGDDTRSNTLSTPPGAGISVDVTSSTATVDQTNGSRNTTYIRQFTDGNSAFVRQIGSNSTDNLADVQQGPGGNNNTASVFQGTGFETVTSNTAVIGQYGTNGYAIIDHDLNGKATSNLASITQTTGSTSNTATITQSSDQNAQFNVASILQAGSNGYASDHSDEGSKNNQSVIQQGTGSNGDKAYTRHAFSSTATASITQNLTATTAGPSNNVASIVQGSYIGNATSMTALIAQEGQNNSALLSQVGTGHKATITQTGNNNIVTGPVSSAGFGLTTGYALGSYAQQDGTGHVLTINQTSLDGASLLGNSVSVSQLGDTNTGTVNQTIATGATGNNIGTLTQNGMGNFGTITQTSTLTP